MKSEKNASRRTNTLNSGGGSHAVVIGGSLAGILAARVLADRFDRVTLIERDRFPAGPWTRPGVPQARHLHALLLRGRQILEGFFPGLREDLLAVGAGTIEAGSEIAWHTPAGWGINFDGGFEIVTFTRDLLDWVVRRRLAEIRNIFTLEGCEVRGLIADDRGTGVAGVAIHFRPEAGGAAWSDDWIAADFIVDAGGRRSPLPQWLAALGYEMPVESVVDSHRGYASRLYEIPKGFTAPWKAVFLQPAPPKLLRGGILFPVEGNRWMVTLVGADRDYPPVEDEGFLEFARSLAQPVIYEAIRGARALTPISGYRNTENRWRHYERAKRWPERLISFGDGACAFNPVYGQGMTAAAQGALLLQELLNRQFEHHSGDLRGVARGFQRRLARINRATWLLATGEDYRYASTEGTPPSSMTRFMHRYMDCVFRLATRQVEVRRRFLQVQQMLRTPEAIFHPRVALAVLGEALRARRAAPASPRISAPLRSRTTLH